MPPDHKSKPSVALIAIASTLLGFLGSTAFVLTRRYMAWSRELYPQDAQAHADMLKAWRWRG